MFSNITAADIVTIIAALGAVIIGILNRKQNIITHNLVNSRMTELLALTRAASKAEGIEQERATAATIALELPSQAADINITADKTTVITKTLDKVK